MSAHTAEKGVCDGCQKRPCVCETVVLPSAENDRRCPECGCGVGMHFFDGCHTAFGFICRCKVTRDQLLTHVFPPGGSDA